MSHKMNNPIYSLDSKTFPYLSEDDIVEIKSGFDLLKIKTSEHYLGASEFINKFEKPSILSSEGINYTLTGTSSVSVLTK